MSRNRQMGLDLDEIDAFNANREKIMLDNAGEYGRGDISEEDSEEEVMRVEEESEEENGSDDDEEIEEEEQVENWGGRKNYYGGDEASDDEESKHMSEEALRQQKKHLQDLAMDDYIDEEMMEDWQKKAESYDSKDHKPQITIDDKTPLEKLDSEEQIAYLEQSFPEFIPLTKELGLLHEKLENFNSITSNKFIECKKVALSGYLSSITSYFAIFIDNLKNDSFISMKDNPVMETILSSREVWRQANELPEEDIVNEDVEHDIEVPVESSDIDEAEFVDAHEEQEEEESEKGSEIDSEDSSSDLDIDVNKQRVIKRIPKVHINDDDFAEGEIDDIDMEDKRRRKKTLRFYTSKIDKAANKRDQALSGDMDVPHKERLFERQQRLIEEARQRGLQKGDIEDVSDDGVEAGDDEYYNKIKEQRLDKKEARKLAHQEAVEAAKQGKLAELQESVGKDGKRAINYQILKNKGLTPHRKKEYRNSRVKKRNQYEKAKKKLKSTRQVYDGNNRGPYQGEKTGIKKGLSRSVKLV